MPKPDQGNHDWANSPRVWCHAHTSTGHLGHNKYGSGYCKLPPKYRSEKEGRPTKYWCTRHHKANGNQYLRHGWTTVNAKGETQEVKS